MKDTKGIYEKDSSHQTFFQKLGRRKPFAKSLSEATTEKTLTWYDLTAYGIAATVGSGIYVTVGRVARESAGPAVIFSTLIAGLLSLLTGICYLEFASALPISGSGYAYFYTLMGEFLGWFIGWNLTLEYGFAAASISDGWTAYLVTLCQRLGWTIPTWLYNVILVPSLPMIRMNLIAGLVILLLGFLVSRGARFGTLFTNAVTVTNLSIILFIIATGSAYVRPSNWSPFIPSAAGIFSGAGEMFFSFIGYDTVSTLAAEAVNPGRDLPIAIGLTVGVATTLYILVGLVITGMVTSPQLDKFNPLTMAFSSVGASWAYYIIAVAALLMMAATMFACLLGQPKIFQAIAIDGLLPKAFARETRDGTPLFSVTASTLLLALVATFLDSNNGLTDMIVFGTLFGMSTLCAGVLLNRFQQDSTSTSSGTLATVVFMAGAILSSGLSKSSRIPLWATSLTAGLTMGLPFLAIAYLFVQRGGRLVSQSKTFSCPLMPLIPCLAIAANSYVMMSLERIGLVILQFAVWTAIGFVIYFGYGMHYSHLNPETD